MNLKLTKSLLFSLFIVFLLLPSSVYANSFACWPSWCWRQEETTDQPCQGISDCENLTLAENEYNVTLWWNETPSFDIELRTTQEQKNAPLDIVFVIDVTGSMKDDLEYIFNAFDHIITMLLEKTESLRIGIVPYTDFVQEDKIAPFYQVLTNELGLPYTDEGSGYNAIMTRFEQLSLGAAGGGDCREDTFHALDYAVNEKWSTTYNEGDVDAVTGATMPSVAFKWRQKAVKIIYVITDAAVSQEYYPDMERVAGVAAEKKIFIIGFTPLDNEITSPCPPTCPPCIYQGSCAAKCEKDSAGNDFCESLCCSGLPHIDVTTGQTQCPTNSICASGHRYARSRTNNMIAGFSPEDTWFPCYDLINVTLRTGGNYYRAFQLSQLEEKMQDAFENVDYIKVDLELSTPISNPLNVELRPHNFAYLEMCSYSELARGSRDKFECRQTRSVYVHVPYGTTPDKYTYKIKSIADTGEVDTLTLNVDVKIPPEYNITYEAYDFNETVLIFFNLYNNGLSRTLTINSNETYFTCNDKKAEILWPKQKLELAPGQQINGIIDCIGNSRQDTYYGVDFLHYKFSPDYKTLTTYLRLSNSSGASISYEHYKDHWTVKLNEDPLEITSIKYAANTDIYEISLAFTGLPEGFSVLEVTFNPGDKKGSNFRLVPNGNSIYVSGKMVFGDNFEEIIMPDQLQKKIPIYKPNLTFEANGIYVHTPDDKIELRLNYTRFLGDYLLYRQFEKYSRRPLHIYNQTHPFDGLLKFPVEDVNMLQSSIFFLTAHSEEKKANRVQIDPIFDIYYELPVEFINKKSFSTNIENGKMIKRVKYNITLYKPSKITFPFLVTENIDSNLHIKSSSENIDLIQNLGQGFTEKVYPDGVMITRDSPLPSTRDDSKDLYIKIKEMTPKIFSTFEAVFGKYTTVKLQIWDKAGKIIEGITKEDIDIESIEGNYVNVESVEFGNRIYTVKLYLEGDFVLGKKNLIIDVRGTSSTGDRVDGRITQVIEFVETMKSEGYSVYTGIEINATKGTLLIEASNTQNSKYIIEASYQIITPFKVDYESQLNIVPNSTNEFLLTVTNLQNKVDSFNICGYGDDLKITVGNVVTSSKDCYELIVKSQEAKEIKVIIQLNTEEKRDANFLIFSVTDRELKKEISVNIAPSAFTKSKIKIKSCEKNEWDISCSYELINAGNIGNKYRYAFSPEILTTKLLYEGNVLDSKESKNVKQASKLIVCSNTHLEKEMLKNLGKAFFITKIYAENITYQETDILSNNKKSISDFVTFVKQSQLLSQANVAGSLESFLLTPSIENAKNAAIEVERFYYDFLNSKMNSCTMTQDKEIIMHAYAVDTPTLVDGNYTWDFQEATYTISDITVPLYYKIIPSNHLVQDLEKGRITFKKDEASNFTIMIQNNMHHPLLFDIRVTASYNRADPIFTKSDVFVENGTSTNVEIMTSLTEDGNQEVYLLAFPTGNQEQERYFDIPLTVIGDAEVVFFTRKSEEKEEANLGKTKSIKIFIENNGTDPELFNLKLEGGLKDNAQLKLTSIEVPPGSVKEVSLDISPKKFENIRGSVIITSSKDTSKTKTLEYTIKVLAPQYEVNTISEIGEEDTSVIIKNTGTDQGIININLEGALTDCLSLDENAISIKPGETKKINIKNTCKRSGDITLHLKGDQISEKKKITVSIEKEVTPKPVDDDFDDIIDDPEITPEPKKSSSSTIYIVLILVVVALVGAVAMKMKKDGEKGKKRFGSKNQRQFAGAQQKPMQQMQYRQRAGYQQQQNWRR